VAFILPKRGEGTDVALLSHLLFSTKLQGSFSSQISNNKTTKMRQGDLLNTLGFLLQKCNHFSHFGGKIQMSLFR